MSTTTSKYLTMTDLEAALAVVDGNRTAMIEKFRRDMKKQLDQTDKQLAAAVDARRASWGASDDDDGGADTAAELVQLRRDLDEARRARETLTAEVAAAEENTRRSALRTRAHEALTSHGCRHPDMLLQSMLPSLQLTDDKEVMAEYRDDYGLTVRRPVDRFVSDRLAKDYPEMFGQREGGKAAGRSSRFTRAQFLDTAFYKANQAEMNRALESGDVDGLEITRS